MCAHPCARILCMCGPGRALTIRWNGVPEPVALRMRGECVCLHVSVCVRADSAAFTCSLSPALSLPPLSLSPSLPFPLSRSHTHTIFNLSSLSSFPPSSPSSSLPASLSVPPPPTLPVPVRLGWGLSLPLWGCLGEHPRFAFPLDHSLPSWVELSRARRLLCATSSLEEGSGERRTPALCP